MKIFQRPLQLPQTVALLLLIVVSWLNQLSSSSSSATAAAAEAASSSSCRNVRQLARNKYVCVCTENNSCDELKFNWPQQSGQAIQIVSSQSGKQFQQANNISIYSTATTSATDAGAEEESNEIFSAGHHHHSTTISVNLNKSYQSILGWGGSFTDSAAINTFGLGKNLSMKLIESYFGDYGLQYNFGRVPIAGSDFSTRKYSYAEVKDDFQLKNWSLPVEDTEFKIPMIKEASRLCKTRGTQLKLIATPWSAPAWMKTSNNLVRGSLIDDKKYYTTYTEYLMKFYRAYRNRGVEFWGSTIQNEPFEAFLPFYYFNSMSFTPAQMIKFVSEYLGPALEAEGMGKDKFKLIVGDSSLGFLEPLATRVLGNEQAEKYISGLAFHWYTSGILMSYDRLDRLYEQVKNKIEFMMMSEACLGSMPFTKHVDLGSWDRGESYALDIIQDMLRHTGAWIDWNMALDEQGGPNWSGNFVDSPIIVDKINNLFYKQPMYYVLAHFSRFFKPGSVRIDSKVEGEERNSLDVVSVKIDETQHVVTNILNRSDRTVIVKVQIDDVINGINYSIPVVIEAKSINSLILKL